MNKASSCLHLIILVLVLPCLVFSATKDYTVLLSATVQKAPAQITLAWPSSAGATAYTIYRRAMGTSSWGASVANPTGGSTGWMDSSVTVGTVYEYKVAKEGTPSGTGYICSGIEAPLVEDRGTVVLLVDSTYSSGLSAELSRLEKDLIGDGWSVVRHDVSPTASVTSVKDSIKADYDAGGVNAVFIFGHVPVPYSGQTAPDGHPDHVGAWPTDGYYGDMTGSWTDATVNITTGSRTENHNIPGDGKFDQNSLPSTLELEVGRVDLSNMTAFAKTEVELLKQYLDKDHNFRYGVLKAERRGIIDDNFVGMSEAFAASGWTSFAAMFGAANINEVDWFTTLSTDSYLWGYGCGPGSYTSASGVGTTTNFVNTDTKVIFTMLFGSYFGDWDSTNNFLRAPLATNSYGLTCAWSGRPWWYFYHMAFGETVGYSARHSMRNGGNSTMGLMGDPTLRMHPVLPVTNLQAVTGGTIGEINDLTWTASADTNIVGYNVYKSSSSSGPYTRVNTDPIAATSYSDTGAGGNYYMVRAVKLETSGSGTYFNGSQGVFVIAGASTAEPFSKIRVYPNPFNINSGTKTLKLIIIPADTIMKIYTGSGELVRTLDEADFGNAGWIEWDGKNNAGEYVARGVYVFVVSNPEGISKTGKIAVLK